MRKNVYVYIICAILMLFLNVTAAKAANYDPKINDALQELEKTDYKWVVDSINGNNLSGKPVQIMFRKLASISPDYADYEALTCGDSFGNILIIIDSSHKNEPAQAIATMLTHEIIHQDDQTSIEEETQGWTNEAKAWSEFKQMYPELSKVNENENTLVARLNKMEKLYKDGNQTSKLIKLAVMEADGYANIAMHSTGY